MEFTCLVCVFVLCALSTIVSAKEIYLCYKGSHVCARKKDNLTCDGQSVIRLWGRFMYNSSTCEGSTCMHGNDKYANEDYELELQRRCSTNKSCDMSDVESVAGLPETFSVYIRFGCPNLDNKAFDPCSTDGINATFTSSLFLLGRNVGDQQSCTCILSPQSNTNISVVVDDIRLGSRTDSCKNNSVEIHTNETRVLYNCTNEPIFNRKIVEITNWKSDVTVSINTGKHVKPEMMLIFFRVSNAKSVYVNCETQKYETTTSKLTIPVASITTASTNTTDPKNITGRMPAVTETRTMPSPTTDTPGATTKVPMSTSSSNVHKAAETGDDGGSLDTSITAAIACIAAVVTVGLTATAMCFIRRRKRQSEKRSDYSLPIANAAFELETNTENGQPPIQQQQVSNDYAESFSHPGARVQDDEEPDYEMAQDFIGTLPTEGNNGFTRLLIDSMVDDGKYSHLGASRSKSTTGLKDDTYSHLAPRSKAPQKNGKQSAMSSVPDTNEFQEDDYDHLNFAGSSTHANGRADDNLYSHITYVKTDKERSDDDVYSYANDVENTLTGDDAKDLADDTDFTTKEKQTW